MCVSPSRALRWARTWPRGETRVPSGSSRQPSASAIAVSKRVATLTGEMVQAASRSLFSLLRLVGQEVGPLQRILPGLLDELDVEGDGGGMRAGTGLAGDVLFGLPGHLPGLRVDRLMAMGREASRDGVVPARDELGLQPLEIQARSIGADAFEAGLRALDDGGPMEGDDLFEARPELGPGTRAGTTRRARPRGDRRRRPRARASRARRPSDRAPPDPSAGPDRRRDPKPPASRSPIPRARRSSPTRGPRGRRRRARRPHRDRRDDPTSDARSIPATKPPSSAATAGVSARSWTGQ
jgi:hypothetical protein